MRERRDQKLIRAHRTGTTSDTGGRAGPIGVAMGDRTRTHTHTQTDAEEKYKQ